MISDKKNNLHYALIHSLFWITYCTGTGYLSSCLLSLGFESGHVGIVIALSGLGSALLQPVFAKIIDKSGKRLLKPVMSITVAVAVIFSILEIVYDTNGVAVAVFYGINIVALQFLIPLMNSMSICSKGNISFGFGRSIGSFSFAIFSLFLGRLVTDYGMNILCVIRTVSFAAFIVAVCTFPIRVIDPADISKRKETGFFKKNPGFLTLMFGCVLVYFSHMLMTYYCYQIVASKGGDNTVLGVVLGIGAFIEAPVMLGFSKLLKIKSASFWFKFSGFGFAIKAVVFLAAGSIPGLYIAALTQMLGWPVISVASVKYVDSITTDYDTTRGQAYITLTYSLALVVGAPVGGIVLQMFGVQTMLIVAAATALAGGLAIRAGIKRRSLFPSENKGNVALK